MAELKRESHFAEIAGGEKLHLERFFSSGLPGAPAALMLHGAIENARIFYSESGKGLAPFLAREGFDAFAADLRGRGASVPRISRSSKHGQLEAITEDLPAFVRKIRDLRGAPPEFWIAHSWGGVLMMSALARQPELLEGLRGLVFFGTKRAVRVWNPERLWKISFGWNFLAPIAIRVFGFLPADRLGMGPDNETVLSLLESRAWVRPGPWVDPRDRFDYASAIRAVKLPPVLNLAGSADRTLGHPADVRDFMDECAAGSNELVVMDGCDHVTLMTAPDAPSRQFRLAAEWMKKHQ